LTNIIHLNLIIHAKWTKDKIEQFILHITSVSHPHLSFIHISSLEDISTIQELNKWLVLLPLVTNLNMDTTYVYKDDKKEEIEKWSEACGHLYHTVGSHLPNISHFTLKVNSRAVDFHHKHLFPLLIQKNKNLKTITFVTDQYPACIQSLFLPITGHLSSIKSISPYLRLIEILIFKNQPDEKKVLMKAEEEQVKNIFDVIENNWKNLHIIMKLN